MRKVLLTLVVSSVLALPAMAAPRRDTSAPGNVMQRFVAFLRGGIVHVLDEIGVPKP